MAGSHLRGRGRGTARTLGLLLAILVVGVALGAGGQRAWEVRAEGTTSVPVTTEPAEEPGSGPLRLEPRRGPITLAFAGDVYAEPPLDTRLAEQPDSFVGPFASVLGSADLAVVNLEAALATGGSAEAKEYTFRAPPTILDALAAGGVDVVSVANNHGMDFGAEGLTETLATKRARTDGMVVGAGGDEDEAYAPYLRSVGGHRVAVIAATQVLTSSLIPTWTAGPDQPGLASAKRVDRLVAEVARVREVADVVVVYLHWGVETEECPSTSQQELARAVVDAGADVVVGAHAHRVQGGGRLGEAVVHYGLGNFLFGSASAASSRTGVLLVTIQDRRVLGYEWVPGRITASVPEVLTGAERDAEVAAWEAQRDCTGLEP